jgi:hypothetical protein
LPIFIAAPSFSRWICAAAFCRRFPPRTALLLARVERAHHLARESVDDAVAVERDELDATRLAGLEAHRGPAAMLRRKASRRCAIERERALVSAK